MNTASTPHSLMSSISSYKPRATRYEPCRNDACLTWRDASPTSDLDAIEPKTAGDPKSRHLFALLLDVSQTGASIVLDRVPLPADGVKLQLEGEGLNDWPEAEVVGVTTTIWGPHLVRLAFRAPCPFETLLAAICG